MRPTSISLSSQTYSSPIPVDHSNAINQISLGCDIIVAGTLTYQVQYTFDDIGVAGYDPNTGNWQTHPTLTAKTVSDAAILPVSVRAVRLNVTAYTSGTVRLTVITNDSSVTGSASTAATGAGTPASGFVTPQGLVAALSENNGTPNALQVSSISTANIGGVGASYDPARVVTLILNGTGAVNNDTAIATALSKLSTLAPTLHNRALLRIQTGGLGRMSFNTPFRVPIYADVQQQEGSRFEYGGTDYSQAAITIGEITAATLDQNLSASGLCIWNLNFTVHKFWSTADGGQVDPTRFAGIRIGNQKAAKIEVKGIVGFYVGLQLFPAPGSLCSHGNFYLGATWAVNKIAIDLRGNTSVGWVNENSFFGPADIATSTSMNAYGSAYGVRISAEAGGYGQNNNNLFWGLCWQLGGNDLGTTWITTAVVTAGATLTAAGREYIVTTGGTTGGSAPSHTSGSAANGSATLKYIGRFRRSPMLCDGAGQNNHIIGGRYEDGYGSPVIVKRNAESSSAVGAKTTCSFTYFGLNTAAANPANAVYADIELEQGGDYLQTSAIGTCWVKEHDKQTTERVLEMEGFRTKAVVGASGVVVPGAMMGEIYSAHGGFAVSRAVTTRVTHRGIVMSGSDGPCFIVPVNAANSRLIVAWSAPSGNAPRFSALAFDSAFAHLPAAANQYPILADQGYVQDSKLTGSVDLFGQVGIAVNSASVAYVVLAFRDGDIDNVYIRRVAQMVHGEGQNLPLSVADLPFDGARYTNGAVTAGVFPFIGERIFDLASATVYRVTTAGVIAPAWTTSTLVFEAEYRSNAGRVYYAITGASFGSTGATAPTHTSGTVSDGVVDWAHVGLSAVLA